MTWLVFYLPQGSERHHYRYKSLYGYQHRHVYGPSLRDVGQGIQDDVDRNHTFQVAPTYQPGPAQQG